MDIILTPDEVLALAGGLVQPQSQLRALRAAGFWRARLDRNHRVILERAHYHAVCAGAVQTPATPARDRPQLQSVK